MNHTGMMARATILMLVWWIVVYGAGSRPELRFQPSWFPHLGVVITNGLGVIGIAIAAWILGIVAPGLHGGWQRAGLGCGDRNRYRWLLPLLACASLALVISRDGLTWPSGSIGMLISSALGLLAVGFSEELGSRGLPLGIMDEMNPWLAVSWQALIFGFWHIGNLIFFGQSPGETLWQIVVSSALGFAFGAARLLTGTILPLIVLHGFNDWAQINTPGATPFWLQVAVVAFQIGWGILILQKVVQAQKDRRDLGPG